LNGAGGPLPGPFGTLNLRKNTAKKKNILREINTYLEIDLWFGCYILIV
jgi:hypothetical protein